MADYMPLAKGVTTTNLVQPPELMAGEAPLITGQGDIGSAAVEQFEVLMVGAGADAGKLVAWDGTAGAAVAIAATPIAAGKRGPVYEGGYFNHGILIWPATMDTYAERRTAFPDGHTIKIGRVL